MIRRLQLLYQKIFTSIAFLPALIGLLFFLFSIFSLYFEYSSGAAALKKHIGVLLVKGNDNARQVLGALIGGIISLTVFSFSMVMVVINQAASQFTPRVIPGVVTDKKSQFILGFYVGTIIYCIILILNINPGEGQPGSPQLGVLVAMFLGIFCLALFVYFIHLIAQKIQVDSITQSAARQSIRVIEKEAKQNLISANVPDTTGWYTLHSEQSGYMSEVNTRKLYQVCKKNQLQLEILHWPGTFLVKDDPICRTNRKLNDKPKLYDTILTCFSFFYEPYGEHTCFYGINQIAEIAVKALSPGINDPGTAIIALDHLIEISCCWLTHRHPLEQKRQPDAAFLFRKEYALTDLLFHFVTPIRDYGKQDAKVHLKLLELYHRLAQLTTDSDKNIIQIHLAEEMATIEKHIHSPVQVALLKDRNAALNGSPSRLPPS